MKFIILPIEDAKVLFNEEELSTYRKSIDGTEVLFHEEILLERREQLGLSILPNEDTGIIEWTYPNYEYDTKEFDDLLHSNKWLDVDKLNNNAI